MRRTLLTLFIVLMLPLANAMGQGINWAFHISNPTGFLAYGLDYFYGIDYPAKVRIKAEVRDSTNAILLCYTHYLIYDEGNALGLEYRRYWQRPSRSENYIYGEIGAIHHYDLGEYWDSRGDGPKLAPYLGAGIGRHTNFGHFFIDLNGGLRYTYVSGNYPPNYYNWFSPGSIVSINASFGFQSHSRTHVRERYTEEF